MGLKGYRLWDMGQLDSTCRAPPRGSGAQVDPTGKQQTLKPTRISSNVRVKGWVTKPGGAFKYQRQVNSTAGHSPTTRGALKGRNVSSVGAYFHPGGVM
jgi:hypothetical protein